MTNIEEATFIEEFTFRVNLALKDEHRAETTITHISVEATTTDEDDACVLALSDLSEEGFSHWFEVESVEVLS